MEVFGKRLESTSSMVPAGGVLGALLPLFAISGLIACIGDFGMPGLEKAIVALGMFSGGVLLSRIMPVWREARPGELERIAKRLADNPVAPWLRMARAIGWSRTILLFTILCAVLAAITVPFLR